MIYILLENNIAVELLLGVHNRLLVTLHIRLKILITPCIVFNHGILGGTLR